MHEELLPVLRDLEFASPVRVEVSEQSGTWWIQVVGTIGMVGHVPGPSADVCFAADRVQDWVVECLPELGLPAVWPECPEHPGTHPLSATCPDGIPVWTCPRSSTVHARIGELTGGV